MLCSEVRREGRRHLRVVQRVGPRTRFIDQTQSRTEKPPFTSSFLFALGALASTQGIRPCRGTHLVVVGVKRFSHRTHNVHAGCASAGVGADRVGAYPFGKFISPAPYSVCSRAPFCYHKKFPYLRGSTCSFQPVTL